MRVCAQGVPNPLDAISVTSIRTSPLKYRTGCALVLSSEHGPVHFSPEDELDDELLEDEDEEELLLDELLELEELLLLDELLELLLEELLVDVELEVDVLDDVDVLLEE